MTDSEINRRVCVDVLGWTTQYDDDSNERWVVPDGQPWHGAWNNRVVLGDNQDTPDFLHDPAETFRLLVWLKADLYLTTDGYVARVGDCAGDANPDPARALCIAVLASKGVEAKDA